MKTNVKILSRFTHGRDTYEPDQPGVSFTKGDAIDLEKQGLVQIIEDGAEPVGTKMQDAGTIENKMEVEPENKSTSTRKKGA